MAGEHDGGAGMQNDEELHDWHTPFIEPGFEAAGLNIGEEVQHAATSLDVDDAAFHVYQTLVKAYCADFRQISNEWCVVQGFDRRRGQATVCCAN